MEGSTDSQDPDTNAEDENNSDKQIPEEGENTNDPDNGSDEGQPPVDSSVEEPATEDATETDVDTVEEPEVPEDSDADTLLGMDGKEIAAAGDEHTVSIKDYASVKKLVDVTVTGGTELTKDGKTTVKEGTAATLTVKVKDTVKTYKIKKVTSGEKEATEASGTWSLALGTDVTADAEVEITLAEIYQVSLRNENADGTSLKVIIGENETAVNNTPVSLEKDGALTFKVDGYEAADDGNDRLKVYYVTDGSSTDDRTEIDSTTTGEGDAAVTTYTVPAAVIASLDESIEIVLEKETKKNVEITENANVTVQYWGKKNADAAADLAAEAWVTDENKASYTEIKTAFVGDTFKFKAVANAGYAITEVKVGKDPIPLTDGEYSITVTEEMLADINPAKISFETAISETGSRTLTFNLTGEEKSANAKITSVTPAATTDTPNPEAITNAEKIAEALGVSADDLTLTQGETLRVLAVGSAIEVTVTPTDGYVLTKTSDDENLEADGSRKVTYSEETLTAAISITATTEVKSSEAKHYFKVTLKETVADGETEKLTNLNVPAADGVTRKTTQDTPDEVYYEVAEGVKTVTFTVDVAEGTKIADALANANYVKSVTKGAVTGGKATWTVILLANKLEGTDAYAGAQEIEVTPAAITLKASVDPDSSTEFIAVLKSKTDIDGEFDEIQDKEAIPYGVAFQAIITPASKSHRLDEVSYVMGTAAAVPVPVEEVYNEKDELTGYQAVVDIPKMTDDVKITVKSGKDLKLDDLQEVTGSVGDYGFKDVGFASEEDSIYAVEYGKRYAIGVKEGSTLQAARDTTVVVKDENGTPVAMTNPIITVDRVSKRTINLATKSLAGQEITAEVSYKGQLVDTYIMLVEKKTTEISINGGQSIVQTVDSTKTYDVTTNGEMPVDVEVTSEDETFKKAIDDGLIRAEIEDGKLAVSVGPAKRADIATSATNTPEGSTTPVTTWTAKKATITVTAPDDIEVEASVEITLNPLFDESAKPTVTPASASDTVINVDVSMADVAAPETGSVWYEVTAAAKGDTPANAETGTPASTKPAELKKEVVKVVPKTGSSNRVALQVSDKELGELAKKWGYDITARLVYMEDDAELPESAAVTGELAHSETSDKKEVSVDVTLFEDSLKLKKVKGAPSTLYTGQNGEIVIAEPQWTKKFTSYQILSDQVYDASYTYDADDDYNMGLKVGVNDDGNIVVTDVPETAAIGKHTITVVAKADMSTGHTMYASRATIAVTVAKGINDLTIAQPSEVIYKDSTPGKEKAGTLKLTVAYNQEQENYNGKKWVEKLAPKSKKIEWKIVDASSTKHNIVDAPAYLKVNDTKNGVTMKNGTVTVAKGFQIDERHANNNRFKVLVEAKDFDGNETKALSETITITKDSVDISTLVIVHDGKISAISNDSRSKTPVEVLASDVDGGYIYALPAGVPVAKDMVWSTTLRKKAVPVENLTISSTSKKILCAGPDKDHAGLQKNELKVLAAGKKAGIKVTTNDGGKKTHTMNLTLDFKATAGNDLALGIAYRTAVDFGSDNSSTSAFAPTGSENVAKANKASDKATPVEVPITVTGAARLDIQLYVGDKDANDSTAYTRPGDINFANYKLAVKGGKFVTNGMGKATVITTANETVLTLTDQTKEAKAAKKAAYVYKIVNAAYDKKLAKAPKVSIKGSLHQYSSDVKEQTLTMNVLNAADKNANFAEGKAVKVEIDWSARNNKNAWMLTYLSTALSKGNKDSLVFVTDKESNVSLPMLNPAYTDGQKYDYDSGSYKVKVTVGSLSGTTFTAETLPATATIKVAKDKAFTFKPATSFTYNKVDGGAMLTGTGKGSVNAKAGEKAIVTYSNLQNVNIKGSSNHFTHYFKLETKDGVQRLVLNENDPLVKQMIFEPEKNADGSEKKDADGNVIYSATKKENPEIKIEKADLTGYITFNAKPNVKYFTNSEYGVGGTVKITVKLASDGKTVKPSQKYAPENAEVALTGNSPTQVNVFVNGSYVKVAYAMIDASKAKSNAADLELANPAVNKDGQICLKTTATAKLDEGKPYSTNLLIVPAGSFYADVIEGAPNAPAAQAAESDSTEGKETKEDLIKKYGISVKVTLLASANPKPTTVPKNDSEDNKGDEEKPPVTDETKEITDTIKNAVKAKVEAAKTTLALDNDSTWEAKGDAILAAAKTATELGDDFDVEKEGEGLSISKATNDAAGTATITLKIVQKNKPENSDTVTCTIEIAKLDNSGSVDSQG